MPIFRIRPNLVGKTTETPTKKSKAINLLLILLVLGSTVVVPIFQAKLVSAGAPNINVNPEAPQGVEQGGTKIANVIYWISWLAVVIVGAVGVLLMLGGKRTTGLLLIGLAIVGVIILVNWQGIINYFAG